MCGKHCDRGPLREREREKERERERERGREGGREGGRVRLLTCRNRNRETNVERT